MTTTDGHGNDDVTQAHEPRYYGARFPLLASRCVVYGVPREGERERGRGERTLQETQEGREGELTEEEKRKSDPPPERILFWIEDSS